MVDLDECPFRLCRFSLQCPVEINTVSLVHEENEAEQHQNDKSGCGGGYSRSEESQFGHTCITVDKAVVADDIQYIGKNEYIHRYLRGTDGVEELLHLTT